MMTDNVNGFEWVFTHQQHEMLRCVGKRWPLRYQFEGLMHLWLREVSPFIPIHSALYVYDYMKETGYYDEEC